MLRLGTGGVIGLEPCVGIGETGTVFFQFLNNFFFCMRGLHKRVDHKTVNLTLAEMKLNLKCLYMLEMFVYGLAVKAGQKHVMQKNE